MADEGVTAKEAIEAAARVVRNAGLDLVDWLAACSAAWIKVTYESHAAEPKPVKAGWQ